MSSFLPASSSLTCLGPLVPYSANQPSCFGPQLVDPTIEINLLRSMGENCVEPNLAQPKVLYEVCSGTANVKRGDKGGNKCNYSMMEP
ncbi:unnamed protein product [Prunus armeniaca]